MASHNTACQTCKTRRIKCDGAKPTCQRCTKSKRHCIQVEATKQAQFAIHDENSFASGKMKRPRGPRSSLTVMRPHIDLATRALSYYLQYHLIAPKDVPKTSGGLSECISEWAISGRMGSCEMVDLALSAMTLAVFSRTQQHPPAFVEASSRYNRLIRITRERIQRLTLSLDEKDIDNCLLAVSLMGRYENVKLCPNAFNTTPNFSTLSSWHHSDGSMAILKVWYDKLDHKQPTPIIKNTRRGLIKTCLLRNQSLPDWMLDGSQFGEEGEEILCDRVLVQLLRHLHTVSIFKSRVELQAAAIEELANEIKGIETELVNWAALIPETCSYRRHTLSSLGSYPRKHFYSSTAFSYPRPENASAWCHYFALFMLFSVTQLRVIDLAQLHSSPLSEIDYNKQRSKSSGTLATMTNRLAYSLPFCLDRFRAAYTEPGDSPSQVVLNLDQEIRPYLARLVAWPLSIASGLDGINKEQQEWFKSELCILGAITGDAVLQCVVTGEWAVI